MTGTAKVIDIRTMRRMEPERTWRWRGMGVVLGPILVWVIVGLVLVFMAAAHTKASPKVRSAGLNRSVVRRIERTIDFDKTRY
jgi:uncharacterized membrane-anchored protein